MALLVRTEAMKEYVKTADALVTRILETFEAHPEAAAITDAWGLFKVPGFNCDDIGPSLAQADWALGRARAIWRERGRGE
jgi:hypothetical protein